MLPGDFAVMVVFWHVCHYVAGVRTGNCATEDFSVGWGSKPVEGEWVQMFIN